MNGNKIASVLCFVATILNIIAGNLEIAIITGILSLLNTLVAWIEKKRSFKTKRLVIALLKLAFSFYNLVDELNIL